ncbi:hypothetical protein BKA93DRAFT_754661 [Sparassis latifolia]
MGRKSKTLKQRKKNIQDHKEAQIALAVAEYRGGVLGGEEKKLSFGSVAREHGVSKSTVWHHSKCCRSIRDFNVQKQLLTPVEEAVVVEFIKKVARCTFEGESTGYTLLPFHTYHSQQVLALRIPQPALYWGSNLEDKHGYALNQTNINDYFDTLEEIEWEHHISAHRKYGMDETGLLLGVGQKEWVIGPAGQRTQHTLQSGV